MAPEGPNWEQCQKAQDRCSGRIHARLDDLFKLVGEVKQAVAHANGIREGEDTASHHKVPRRFNWREVAAAIIIIGTAIAMLIVLIRQPTDARLMEMVTEAVGLVVKVKP